MKALITICIIALLSVFGHNSAGQVPVAPPHRGIVQKSGDFSIELVRGINKYIFYVLDKNNKPVSLAGASGIVSVRYSDNTYIVSNLSAFGENALSIIIHKAGIVPSLSIGIKVNGKSFAAVYHHVPGVIQAHRHAYTYGKDYQGIKN